MAKKDSIKGIAPFSNTDWQTEDDLRTLTRAVEIKKDPKRMKAAQALAKKKLEEMALISVDNDD